MASPNLTTECTAFPHLPMPRPTGYDRDLTAFEDDATQSVLISTTKHREFKLQYRNQSDAQKASFEAFHDARMLDGAFFYFNDIRTGEVDIKVKFREGKPTYNPESVRTWGWDATIFQVAS